MLGNGVHPDLTKLMAFVEELTRTNRRKRLNCCRVVVFQDSNKDEDALSSDEVEEHDKRGKEEDEMFVEEGEDEDEDEDEEGGEDEEGSHAPLHLAARNGDEAIAEAALSAAEVDTEAKDEVTGRRVQGESRADRCASSWIDLVSFRTERSRQ